MINFMIGIKLIGLYFVIKAIEKSVMGFHFLNKNDGLEFSGYIAFVVVLCFIFPLACGIFFLKKTKWIATFLGKDIAAIEMKNT